MNEKESSYCKVCSNPKEGILIIHPDRNCTIIIDNYEDQRDFLIQKVSDTVLQENLRLFINTLLLETSIRFCPYCGSNL